MSCAAKPLSMATFLLSSSPSIFPAKTHQHISLPFKPINLHLSSSSSFKPFSIQNKPHFPRTVTFVTSQEEDNTLVLQPDEQPTWENENLEPEPADSADDDETNDDTGVVSEWGNETSETEDSGPVETEVFDEDAKIFVGNLPYNVDSEQLAQLFQQAGVVEISEVKFIN